MKKLMIILLVCITSHCFAETIHFEENSSWSDIKARAIATKKMIFLDAYTSWCGPCKFLETSVYTNDSVARYYNDQFINVKYDMEKGEGIELAREFDIITFPTLLFFTPEGKLVHKNVGALQVPDFLSLGKDAGDPDKQYFTLKQKVADRIASNSEFLQWTKLADDMQDRDRSTVAAAWLSGQKDILATAELAKATLLYADVSTEQLRYLYDNKERIQQLLNWDAEKVSKKLYQKLFTMAAHNAELATRSIDPFGETIIGFEPEKLAYAQKDLAILEALKENKQTEAITLLIAALHGEQRLSLKETASLLFTYIPRFDEDAVTHLKKALASYKLNTLEIKEECWLYLMQVVCYSRTNEPAQAKLLAEKAAGRGCLPSEYQNFLRESFGVR